MVRAPGCYTFSESAPATSTTSAAHSVPGLVSETLLAVRPPVAVVPQVPTGPARAGGWRIWRTAVAVVARWQFQPVRRFGAEPVGLTRRYVRPPAARVAVAGRLLIPRLGVDAPVEAVPSTEGVMAIPDSPRRLGWLRSSARAGDAAGSSVLAGHVSDRHDRRGPWAGPVSAAAVILNPRKLPNGLNDSKVLTAKRRDELEIEIKAKAVAYAVGFASVGEIAELNILHATGLAMCRAIEAMAVQPAYALVDGNYRFKLPCEVKTVVGGDGRSKSIAAASILAKVARDRLMAEMDAVYPGYGFSLHKGYRAPIHGEALLRLGPSPIHRLAWGPVKLALMGLDPMQAYGDAVQEELALG